MDKFVRQCNGTEVHFLIGSGVSCSAGLPSISEITETLTNGGEDQPANAEVAFLRLLGTEVDSVFARMFEDTRLANYEDLFYVASQIGADFWEYENPATMDFVERILKDERFVRVAADEDPDSSTDADVGWLANHSVRFIQTGVQRILEQGSEIADRSALGLFADAAEDPWTGSIDIFSLNHDTVLEQLFFERQIPFEDGLSVREGDLSFWCLPSLDKSLAKVQLLKLHGSVDWWQFGRLVGKARANPYNPYYLRDRHGHRIEPPGEGPVILIGTFNKMLKQAGEGIFLDLLGLYSRRLREASRLVIAGYGFGDKGINSVLGAWLEDRRGKAFSRR
ncbi:MAG: SIR2 family protein [Actinobacteria bacterium]|nr:SIR2 family protein [Actinomycetota bacterium]